MERIRLDVVFGAAAMAALVFAGWMYVSNMSLHQELENARAASRVFENAAVDRVNAADEARAAAESAIADLKTQLTDVQKENDASRKQIEQQLTTSETARDTAERNLKDANEQLAQLKAAKDAAEFEAVSPAGVTHYRRLAKASTSSVLGCEGGEF